jgi:hypothetical protein
MLKSFKQFDEEQLDEGLFSSLRNAGKFVLGKVRAGARVIGARIKAAFSKLGFGQRVKINLNYATGGKALNEAADDTFDLKSRMGYYSEFCTAYEVAKLIQQAGGTLVGMKTAALLKHRNDYKANKLLCKECNFPKAKPADVAAEAQRMEESGVGLAQAIWNDIQQNATDLDMIEFEVVLTGESGKGTTKADIELFARKKSTKEVVDHIEASLKAYKDWNINVSNSTFTSWVINLVAPEIGGFSNKGSVESKVTEFVKKYGLEKEMRAIQEYQSGENAPSKLKKKIGREAAKKMVDDEGIYIKVRDLMIKVFEQQYKSRKEEINENMLKLLGFDGADDLYLAVQKKAGAKTEVLSSRQSKGFNDILDAMKKGYTIEFEKSNKKVNTSVIFKSGKTVLFKSNFGFRDLDKVSQFVSFKDWK